MSFFRCKIDLTKINKEKDLFKSEKGAIYLDFTMVERKEVGKYGDTHAIYIKKSKDDEKRYIGTGELISGNTEGDTKSAPIEDSELPF